MVRISFDASLPMFVSRDTNIGGEAYKQDDPLPWRELGISEDDLIAFYSSGLVYFAAAVADVAPSRKKKNHVQAP